MLLKTTEDGIIPGPGIHQTRTTSTTTAKPVLPALPPATGCAQNGVMYEEGDSIETEDPCEHCYCMQGKTVCAVSSCMGNMDDNTQHCVPPLPPPPGQCCPTEYKCGV